MRTRPQFKVLSRASQRCASRRRAIDRDGAVSVDRSRKHADHQRACTARGRELAALARSLPPQSISSATWSRTQRPALDVFPKSLARRTRPLRLHTNSVNMRSTSPDHCRFTLTSRDWAMSEAVPSSSASFRCCETQLAPMSSTWSSRAAELVWRSAGEAARELFGRRPSYWSRPRPPAGRSRRERTPV